MTFFRRPRKSAPVRRAHDQGICGVSERFQEVFPVLSHRQKAQKERGREAFADEFFRNPQQVLHEDAPYARRGIAPGRKGRGEIGVCLRPFFQGVFQSLRTVGDGAQFLFGRAQQGVFFHRLQPLFPAGAKLFQALLHAVGQGFFYRLPFPPSERRAYGGRRRIPAAQGLFRIAAPRPFDGQEGDVGAKRREGARVFHAQDIVRGVYHVGDLSLPRRSAGADKALALPQPPADLFGDAFRLFVQRARRFGKLFGRAAFRPEAQTGKAGDRGKQFHGAPCKQFGGGGGKDGGEFENGVGARQYGVSRPFVPAANRRFSPLHETPAHDAHDRVAARKPLCFLQLIEMSEVEGVVFANNPANFHRNAFLFLYNLGKLWYNSTVCKEGDDRRGNPSPPDFHYTRKTRENKAFRRYL